MTWTRISDNFTDSPAMLTVSRSARFLAVEALCWANKHLTDGAIPRAALTRFSDSPDPLAEADELMAAGVWIATDTGWQIDWSDQLPADEVRARQDRIATKQRRYRERLSRHNADDHSQCDPRHCTKRGVTGNVTGNETSNVTGLVTPSPPLPSPPDPTPREGRGAGTGRRGAKRATSALPKGRSDSPAAPRKVERGETERHGPIRNRPKMIVTGLEDLDDLDGDDGAPAAADRAGQP